MDDLDSPLLLDLCFHLYMSETIVQLFGEGVNATFTMSRDAMFFRDLFEERMHVERLSFFQVRAFLTARSIYLILLLVSPFQL